MISFVNKLVVKTELRREQCCLITYESNDVSDQRIREVWSESSFSAWNLYGFVAATNDNINGFSQSSGVG